MAAVAVPDVAAAIIAVAVAAVADVADVADVAGVAALATVTKPLLLPVAWHPAQWLQ